MLWRERAQRRGLIYQNDGLFSFPQLFFRFFLIGAGLQSYSEALRRAVVSIIVKASLTINISSEPLCCIRHGIG